MEVWGSCVLFLSKNVFLDRLDEVQEELLYYPRCRRWRRHWRQGLH